MSLESQQAVCCLSQQCLVVNPVKGLRDSGLAISRQDQSGSLPPHQTPTYQIHATSHLDPIEEDFAIAVRLQEDELEQYSARQPGTTRVRADSGTMSPALTEM